ncbi:MAG: helix-turn-helix transcriptional regulator [Syntrophus sp. (in: bacteria)]
MLTKLSKYNVSLGQERGKLQQACDLLRLNKTTQEALEYLVFIYLTHGIISRGKACELLEIDRADLDDWLTYKDIFDHGKNYVAIGERIKLIRRGCFAEEFSKFLGIHRNTLSAYETGSRAPSTEFLIRLNEIMQIDINWLLTGQTTQGLIPVKTEYFENTTKRIDDTFEGRNTTLKILDQGHSPSLKVPQ